MSWDVMIAEPWELGPSGSQRVTVVSVDPSDHSVTLKREGSGDGFFDSDARQVHVTRDGKSYPADLKPGESHWMGYTTFREGMVISDELRGGTPCDPDLQRVGIHFRDRTAIHSA